MRIAFELEGYLVSGRDLVMLSDKQQDIISDVGLAFTPFSLTLLKEKQALLHMILEKLLVVLKEMLL